VREPPAESVGRRFRGTLSAVIRADTWKRAERGKLATTAPDLVELVKQPSEQTELSVGQELGKRSR
jgi:hypothetical protein